MYINPFIHNKSLKSIKQPSTFMQQSIAKTKLGLAQAGSPRSGERSDLAQAADSRLGETAIVPLEGFANSRLGEAVSPGRDCSSLKKNTAARLGERSSRNLASSRYSRLGEMSSPGRVYRFPPLFHACSNTNSLKHKLTHDSIQSIMTASKAFLHHHKQHTSTRTRNRTNTYKKVNQNAKSSFPYLERAYTRPRHQLRSATVREVVSKNGRTAGQRKNKVIMEP